MLTLLASLLGGALHLLGPDSRAQTEQVKVLTEKTWPQFPTGQSHCASCLLCRLSIMLPEPGEAGRGPASTLGRGAGLSRCSRLRLPARCSLPPSSPHPCVPPGLMSQRPSMARLGLPHPGTTVKPPPKPRISAQLSTSQWRAGVEVLSSGGQRTGSEAPAPQHPGWGWRICCRVQASFPHPPNEDGSSQ